MPSRAGVETDGNKTYNGKRDLPQLRPIQLLNRRKKSVAVDVHNTLRQVPPRLELRQQRVGVARRPRDLVLVQLGLAPEDAIDLFREDLVAGFLVLEELGALGGVVDYLGDLSLVKNVASVRGAKEEMDLCLVDSILACFCQAGPQEVVL